MRKTIYVPDQKTWDEVKRQAGELSLSVSGYLLGRFGVPVENKSLRSGRLDRIESKLDQLLGSHKTEFKEIRSDDDDLREKYKASHPNEQCPRCRNKNKDCVC